ncbi:MAG: hypothetical protein KAF91_19095 [Nostoc sp. TH1S01]|nr:hypothetical protein [Nostoc sp. TH1S01]
MLQIRIIDRDENIKTRQMNMFSTGMVFYGAIAHIVEATSKEPLRK